MDRAIQQIEQEFHIGLNLRWVPVLNAAQKVTELVVDLGRDNLRDITEELVDVLNPVRNFARMRFEDVC